MLRISCCPSSSFTREVFVGEYDGVLWIVPVGGGRSYAYQHNGIIWILGAEGETSEQAVLDISEEVLPNGNHGLMSVVLNPDLATNGFMYLLFAVDAHYLSNFGTRLQKSSLNVWVI